MGNMYEEEKQDVPGLRKCKMKRIVSNKSRNRFSLLTIFKEYVR